MENEVFCSRKNALKLSIPFTVNVLCYGEKGGVPSDTTNGETAVSKKVFLPNYTDFGVNRHYEGKTKSWDTDKKCPNLRHLPICRRRRSHNL